MTPKQRIRNHLNSINAGMSEKIGDLEFHVDALYECATTDAWHPLSELTGPSRYVLVSGPQGVEKCWFDARHSQFGYPDMLVSVDNLDAQGRYAWQSMPEGHKP